MNKCAFDRDGKCIALCGKQCIACAFRKTEDELNDGRQKATDRLLSLPKSTRIHIARKYYGKGSLNG